MNHDINSGEPLYQIVSETIKNDIITGKYLPGQILPSVNSLCDIFSASRMTVHKSLKNLEAEGFIMARPGKGYFVCAPEYDKYTLTFSDEAESTQIRKIDVISPPDEVARIFRLSPSEKVVEMVRVIMKENFPVACDIRYCPYIKGTPVIESEINFAVFPEMAAKKISPFAFHTHLELSVGTASARLSQYLKCNEGEPLLIARRILVDSNHQNIGYSIKYMVRSYGNLLAESGLQLKP